MEIVFYPLKYHVVIVTVIGLESVVINLPIAVDISGSFTRCALLQGRRYRLIFTNILGLPFPANSSTSAAEAGIAKSLNAEDSLDFDAAGNVKGRPRLPSK